MAISDKDEQSLRTAISDLKADFNRRIDDLHAKSDASLENASKVIQEHPLLALGTALAVGVLVGALLGRKSSD